MNSSGAITAANAASGAYLSPRRSQSGMGISFSGIMKKERVIRVTSARPIVTMIISTASHIMAPDLRQQAAVVVFGAE